MFMHAGRYISTVRCWRYAHNIARPKMCVCVYVHSNLERARKTGKCERYGVIKTIRLMTAQISPLAPDCCLHLRLDDKVMYKRFCHPDSTLSFFSPNFFPFQKRLKFLLSVNIV